MHMKFFEVETRNSKQTYGEKQNPLIGIRGVKVKTTMLYYILDWPKAKQNPDTIKCC